MSLDIIFPSQPNSQLLFFFRLKMWILPRTRALSSISVNRFPSHSSYFSTVEKKQTFGDNLMVDYLVNSIGLSREEAISASSKVSHLKSTQNPDSVINFFKLYGGLDNSQIKDLVFSLPRLLTHKADQTLESKFIALKDFGLSGCKLVKLVKRQPRIFHRGLNSNIMPNFSYLAEFLGEDLFIAIYRFPWISNIAVCCFLQPNLLVLEDFGFSKDEVRKFFIAKPAIFMQKPESLQNVMERGEKKLGIPRDSKMFIHGVMALTSVSDAKFEKKVGVFRSLGWSDSDVLMLFMTLPQCLALSEVKVRNALNFFMKELGDTPAYLASHPAFFTYSLEKRVKPRYQVLKTLKEHKLVKSDTLLYSLAKIPEVKFLMGYVLPYRDKIPGFYEAYTNSGKPAAFMQKPESLQNVMERVEKKLGIPRDSKMFIHGVLALTGVSDAKFEKKVSVFRSLGWSDSDVLMLFKTLPQCLDISEVKIRNALNFFMKELGYSLPYLVTLPAFFTYSLEKRVKPRYEVLKTLKEHKLVKSDKPLYSLAVLPEVKFLMGYVLPYKDKIPGFYETYTNSGKHLSKA